MLKNYFITTFRNLFRNKVNTFINTAGLAISIACCIAIYVFVKFEKSYDGFHANADRIYRVVCDYKTPQGEDHAGYVSFPLAKAMRNDFPEMEKVTMVYTENTGIINIPQNSGERKLFEEKEIVYADEFFLEVFKYQLLAGNKSGLLRNPDEVVLTKEVADKYYGKSYEGKYDELIGKTILVNKEQFRISGVLEDIPRNTNVNFRMLLPMINFERQSAARFTNWKDTYSESYAFVMLKPGVSASQLINRIVSFGKKYLDRETANTQTYALQPLAEVHTDEKYGGTVYATPGVLIIAFITMGIIVLLTACINFINLATAQSIKRAKEIGIRKTLGGRQWQLLLQFMGETFLLTSVAALIGLYLAQQFITAFNNYLAFIVDLDMHLDQSILYFLPALVLVITLFAGYYPAKVMAGFQPIKALKHSIRAKNTSFANRFSMRKVLVVTQFTVSQLLIIGTIIVATQMHYFRNTDLKYKRDAVYTMDIPTNDPQKLALLRNELMQQSQVEDVAFSSGPPTSASNSFGGFRLPQAQEKDNINVERKYVDDHFIPTFNIKIVAGRNLQASDKISLKDSNNVYNAVVNKNATEALGFANANDAIGKQVVVNKQDRVTIVGVTDDFYNVTLQNQIMPCVMFFGTNWVSFAAVKLKNTDNANAAYAAIQKSWEKIFPENVYKAQTMDEYIYNKAFYIMEDIMYQAFKIFLVLAIIIGCLGLYGLVSFLALQRQKEIGIRKVLGASVKGILYLFSKEFAWLVIIGFLVAAPVGYFAMQSWLETFANRIEMSPWYFVLAFFVSLLVAALTVNFQALKAAMLNPVKSLRSE